MRGLRGHFSGHPLDDNVDNWYVLILFSPIGHVFNTLLNIIAESSTVALNNCNLWFLAYTLHIDMLTIIPQDLQSTGQLAQLSWEDSPTGPRHAPVWTSICKRMSLQTSSPPITHITQFLEQRSAKVPVHTSISLERQRRKLPSNHSTRS